MKNKYLNKVMISLTIIFFIMPNLTIWAEEVEKVSDNINTETGEKYEEVRFGDNNILRYRYGINSIDSVVNREDMIKKIEAMNDFKILKPKTNEDFELALAYSDGSYTYVESAKTLDEAMIKVKVLEENYTNNIIIPSIINERGQVVYATNSMGRIWNHRDGIPLQGDTVVTNLYSTPNLGNEFTYINQLSVDDVPIIEDGNKVAKIQVNGYTGWINKDVASGNHDLVVVPINQVTNPSCYLVQDGALYHYISTNMTFNGIKGHSVKVGIAPSYLKEGVDYYSYDGVYFYEGKSVVEGLNKLITDLKNNTKINSINSNNPNYNYYEYLPFRTKTNYTANDLNGFINNNTEEHSKLRGLGEVLIESQNKYGVNAVLTLGLAIHESNAGKSDIAQEKNNLFGMGAVDSNPGEEAASFDTPADSVIEFTKNYISRGYADPSDWRYFGGYLGNKQLGANVKYASDPFWGEKAAKYAFMIDYELSNGDINNLTDYNGYQLAIYTGSNKVEDSKGNILYNINPAVSGWGGYAGNVVALKFNELTSRGKYEIFAERTTPLYSGGDVDKYHGNYEWSNSGYISSDSVEFINISNSIFIPGYDKEDVDRNGEVDIEDLAKVSLMYNIKSESSDFKKYLDINNDNIIDIFDLVKISIKI